MLTENARESASTSSPGVRGSAPEATSSRATSPRVCLAMWLTAVRPPGPSRTTWTATVRSASSPAGFQAAA